MKNVAVLLIKAANGGLFVAAFAVLGEMAKPKRFAGLFSAAPSVALANLVVTLVTKGALEGRESCRGMVIGGLAFVLAAAVAVPVLRRTRVLAASAVVGTAWLLVAEAGYLAVLR
jgi:hypothetical protein